MVRNWPNRSLLDPSPNSLWISHSGRGAILAPARNAAGAGRVSMVGGPARTAADEDEGRLLAL